MLRLLKSNLLIVIVLVLDLHRVNSRCRQSYVTICDTFEDFKNLKDTENLGDVMIGSEDGFANMAEVNLHKDLQLNKFNKLSTLTIVRAINGLKKRDFYTCFYRRFPLHSLSFYGNVIRSIGSGDFPEMKSLKRLILVNNKIESLKKYAFVNHGIEEFDISDNLLELIERASFPINRNAKIITVRNNRLSHIEPESFPRSLERLNLDRNRLRYIQDAVLENLPKLQELTLSHNNLNELPKIDQLKGLVYIDFSYNSLTTVKKDIFKDMKDLEFLDLSNNRIEDVQIFKLVHSPQHWATLTYSFAFNRLQDLDVDGVELKYRQTLVLYGNPWDCEKWLPLKTKLDGHESQCDKNFSAVQDVPYCLSYNTDNVPPGYIRAGWYEPYIDRLQSNIKKKVQITGCVLKQSLQSTSFAVDFVCTDS